MSDDNNTIKTTLIKQTKPTSQEDTTPKASQKHTEKKKVVVVKKRVVVVKPQAKHPQKSAQEGPSESPEEKKPEPQQSLTGEKKVESPSSVKPEQPKKPEQASTKTVKPPVQNAQATVSPQRPQTPQKPQQARTTVRRKAPEPFKRTPNAGVSTIKVIDPKNLPPVPGQGQNAQAHVEWRKTNPNPDAQRAAGTGPRKVGQVGGYNPRQNAGERPPRNTGGPGGPGGPGGAPRRYNNTGRPSDTGYRPGGPRPPRPGGPRPGGFTPRSDAPATPEAHKPGKKVFRKKKNFTKRDKETEKNFQIKKKDIHRANPVPKRIDIMDVITVSDLAKKMNLKANEVIAKLFEMGMMVTINQQIDSDVATIIANEYNCEVNLVSLYDETLIQTEDDIEEDLVSRAPIVTIMGHVDHGKTKLLDAIRSTDVVAGEFGGITQHIGAYKVSLPERGDVVFLDTPGHAAFTMMRARGAQVTDIVVLVVAANDGVMPQTIEAIDHAKAAKVPIIVAVNKIDLHDANIDRVKQQLSDHGLMPEDWGGDTLFCELSALKNIGIDELLDTILLQAEMLELTANPNVRAEGKIIESRIDPGRGTVASIIIERGTLRIGDNFVAGIYPGKVRAMTDDHGQRILEAGPATPVEITGLSDIPGAGDPFQVTENDKQARQVGSKRQELERLGQAKNVKKVTLDNIFDKLQDGEIQEFNVIIKGDVQGSVEAVQHALEKLSNKEIRLNAIRASAGAIIEDDVNLAIASNALVLGFNVRPTPRAQTLAEQEKIEIRKYNIIYDAVDDIRDAMEGMLSPERTEIVIGTLEVRDIFKVPKIGTIAGCYVTSGKIRRNAQVNVIRDSIRVHTGKISSLKRFKDDAKEVAEGFECGVGIENYQDLRSEDVLEVIDVVEKKRKLVADE